MRLAVIDIGTNSTRLLVADYIDGTFRPLCRELSTTRLGSGLIQSGLLSETGKTTTFQAVQQFKILALRQGAEAVWAFGTSAMREAKDGTDFAASLQNAAGLPVKILTTEEEAGYSYTGVVRSLSGMDDALVFDLGGGSCELIWPDGNAISTISLKIGAVYLTDTFFAADPPLPSEVQAMQDHIRKQLEPIQRQFHTLAGVGGTVTSLAAMDMKMERYNPAKIHGYRLSLDSVVYLLQRMLLLRAEERICLPGLQKERATILPAGTLVVTEVMRVLDVSSLVVSEGDILLGSLYHFISST